MNEILSAEYGKFIYSASVEQVMALAEAHCPVKLEEGLHRWAQHVSREIHDDSAKPELSGEFPDALTGFIVMASLLAERRSMIAPGDKGPPCSAHDSGYGCTLKRGHACPEHVAHYDSDDRLHLCHRWAADPSRLI